MTEVTMNSWAIVPMGVVFLFGYLAIIFEHQINVNKAASALLTACGLWILYFLGSTSDHEHSLGLLSHQLSSISEIVFFLMGAMTIVELIDSHNGFTLLTDMARPMSRKVLCLVVSIVTFFMSSVLDNLTTTLVMVTLLRRFIADREERILVGGLVVIAANAGGAWTPIGDVTTTMLWLKGNISTFTTMKNLFLPSLASILVAVFGMTWGMKGSYEKPDLSLAPRQLEPGGKLILFLGVLTFVLVPVFKMVTHLPAYMGILLGLSILWIITDWLHDQSERHKLRVSHALMRIDSSSLLFFLGILLAVGALEHAQILTAAAYALDQWFGSKSVIITLIGLISAVIDNVPLVAASMSMYSLSEFPIDHALWQWIAFCAGTGGSILIVGSAAGVALMGLEHVPFVWYARRVGVFAFLSYIAGIAVLVLQGIIP